MAKTKIHHIQMTVTNIERSVDFYVNKIGLKLLQPPREMLYPLDPRKITWSALLTDDDGTLIQLGSPGYTHICLAVDDVEKTIEEFRCKGIEVAKEPFQMPDGKKSPMWFKDPDGVWIEIVEQ